MKRSQEFTGGTSSQPEETLPQNSQNADMRLVSSDINADPALLLPPEDDGADDPYLLSEEMQEIQQEEAALSALLWPEEQTPAPKKHSRGRRRMSKEAFTKALAEVVSPPPVFSFTTVKQSHIIRLSPSERAIINAPPGTGKTYALVSRIFRLLDQGTPPETIIVLCADAEERAHLSRRIRSAAAERGLEEISTRLRLLTLEMYASELASSAVMQNLRGGSAGRTLYQTAAAILDQKPEMLGGLRHLLADDVQNIVGPQAAFFLKLTSGLPSSAGWTYFGDRCEAIFDLPASKANYAMSDQLYGQLLHTYRDAALLTMEKNYRSTRELTDLFLPYREAIISGHPAEVEKAAIQILRQVRSKDIPWHDLHPAAFRPYTRKETLGILTRTAGEALAISGVLYRAGIAHSLLVPNQEKHYGAWLGRLLFSLRKKTVSEEEFTDAFNKLYPHADVASYWDALRRTQKKPQAGRFAVRDLLTALQDISRYPALIPSPDEKPAPVTVSTIPMAGGLEFDSVLLASDLLNGGYTKRAKTEAARRTEAQVLAESRQVYVALTRAKKHLYLMMLPPEAVRLSKLRSRGGHNPERWYKSQIRRIPGSMLKSYRRRSLHAFEIGVAADLIPETFAESEETQYYLRDTGSELPNAELELRLENTEGAPSYELIDPDVPSLKLAQTDADFLSDLTSALGYAKKVRRNDVQEEHYPSSFREIYVRRVVTHIGPADAAPPRAKIYGGLAVWLGLEILGFARASEASD